MFQHLFGPVPSRRLGISLGVDLVPHKTCTLNCVYCESGKTTNLTLERKEYVPTEPILVELNDFLKDNPRLDYITFSGAGEPTLHSDIGVIINFIKKKYPQYKLALITNGTLFYLPDLRDEVKPVDLILPSLDAASDKVFKKINHAHGGLKIGEIIKGLIQLRENFSGEIWLEVFIVPGINDAKDEISALRQAIHRIKPDLVQLNTLDRPGTDTRIQPATKNALQEIAASLNWQTEIIAKFIKKKKPSGYNMDIENTILQTLIRRPCTYDDLLSILGIHRNELTKYVNILLNQNKITSEAMERGVFFRVLN